MTIDRLNANDPVQPRPRPAGAEPGAPSAPRLASDEAHFSPASQGAHEVDPVDKLAHKVHHPHGAMHAIEAGEHAVRAAGRVIGRASRVAAAAAEMAHDLPSHGHHHGLLHRAEHAASRFFSATARVLGGGIRMIPGGGRALELADRALNWPGQLLGRGVDRALAGTRMGGAVQMTGSGARFMGAIGGRLPLVGSLLGGVIAVSDARSTQAILADHRSTRGERLVAIFQGGLSIASGVLGVAALGVAAVTAVGLSVPISVPFLLAAAAVAGVGAFALAFFKKPTH